MGDPKSFISQFESFRIAYFIPIAKSDILYGPKEAILLFYRAASRRRGRMIKRADLGPSVDAPWKPNGLLNAPGILIMHPDFVAACRGYMAVVKILLPGHRVTICEGRLRRPVFFIPTPSNHRPAAPNLPPSPLSN